MREVYVSDVIAAARALLAVPQQLREDVCARMLREADWADKYVKRLGKIHKTWGNGSLMAVARGQKLMPERSFADSDYLACFMVVLDGLQRHRADKTCKLRLQPHMKIKLHHGFAFG